MKIVMVIVFQIKMKRTYQKKKNICLCVVLFEIKISIKHNLQDVQIDFSCVFSKDVVVFYVCLHVLVVDLPFESHLCDLDCEKMIDDRIYQDFDQCRDDIDQVLHHVVLLLDYDHHYHVDHHEHVLKKLQRRVFSFC